MPAVVHDGQVIIESIDIIDYLDERYPNPRLRPLSEDGLHEMHVWMERADAAQHSLKTLTHEFLFKPGRMTPDQLARFLTNHRNEELCEFMKVFCSEQGFPKSEIDSELKHQDRHPNLLAWYERFEDRSSYRKGMTDCEIPAALIHFKKYSEQRAAQGTGITAFGPLAVN